MSGWQFVPLAGVAASPWRNGGGVTRELLAWPAAQDWQARFSVADVQAAGPFSRFEGIERWFAVLEGEGVLLTLNGTVHRCTSNSEPLQFDGGAEASCELLGGATRDFNFMVLPGHGRMVRLRTPTRREVAAGRLVAVYSHAGELRLDGTGVAAATLAWRFCEHAATIDIEAADALWMEVFP